MCGVTKNDRKKFICEKLSIDLIEDKMMKNYLRWYKYMLRRHVNIIITRCKTININDM